MLRPLLLGALLVLLGAGCGAPDHSVAPPDATPVDSAAHGASAQPNLDLALPTANDALLCGDSAAFYQGVNRAEIPGLRQAAWEGGRYGFVRSPTRVPGEIDTHLIFSQLHEGLDIRPLALDAAGEPLDSVIAVAAGRVVHVNDHASNSSYGRHVVLEHRWSGTPVYSLYAHLAEIGVREGDRLAQGAALGRLGYTGRGLAKHRAHLHFEIALLLNRDFQAWFDAYYGQANPQGRYFGKNLAGVDAAALYRALAEDPSLTFAGFMRQQPVAYRLALPSDRRLDVAERYPWLRTDVPADRDTTGRGTTDQDSTGGAWLIGFTRAGVPVGVTRRAFPVQTPTVRWVAPGVERARLGLRGFLARDSDGYHLTRSGRAYAALLLTEGDDVPGWF